MEEPTVSTLNTLPDDAFANVMLHLGPPWPTQHSTTIQTLRQVSHSLRHAVDHCDLLWSKALQSAWGEPGDGAGPQYEHWTALHTAAQQWQHTPVRRHLGSLSWPRDSPLVAATALTPMHLYVGRPCFHGHRPTVAAVCTGRQITWLYWDTCTPCTLEATANSDVEVFNSSQLRQGHTGAILAVLPVLDPASEVPCAWATASADHTVKYWTLDSSCRDTACSGDGDMPSTAAPAPRPPHKKSTVTRAEEVRPVRTLRQHSEAVTCLAVVGDTQSLQSKALLASGSADKTICLCSLHPLLSSPAGSPASIRVGVLRGHEKPLTCLLSHTPGSLLLSGGQDGRVRVWDVAAASSSGSSGSSAALHGWRLQAPVKQLVRLGDSAACSSAVVTVMTGELSVLDPRLASPVCSIKHPSSCRPSWDTTQAVCAGHHLACVRGTEVAVWDVRVLGGGRGPLHRLSTHPRCQWGGLHMDSYKVAAVALGRPAGNKHRLVVQSCVHCWDVRDGHLLTSFHPTSVAAADAASVSQSPRRVWPPPEPPPGLPRPSDSAWYHHTRGGTYDRAGAGRSERSSSATEQESSAGCTSASSVHWSDSDDSDGEGADQATQALLPSVCGFAAQGTVMVCLSAVHAAAGDGEQSRTDLMLHTLDFAGGPCRDLGRHQGAGHRGTDEEEGEGSHARKFWADTAEID